MSMELEVVADHPITSQLGVVLLLSSLIQGSYKCIKMYVEGSLAMNMGVQMPFLTGGTIGPLIHLTSTESVSLMERLITTSGPMLLVQLKEFTMINPSTVLVLIQITQTSR